MFRYAASLDAPGVAWVMDDGDRVVGVIGSASDRALALASLREATDAEWAEMLAAGAAPLTPPT